MAKRNDGNVFEGSFDELKDSAWLCSSDIPWDKDTRAQIKEIRKHKDLEFVKETKGVAGSLWLNGCKKPLLLNAGHRTILKMLFGDAKRAQGQWIALYVDPEVEAFGKIVSAVRIRAKRVDPPGKGQPATSIASGNAQPPDDLPLAGDAG